ncbi:MAG TPA: glycogen debranching N-terminal domain-containing protein [Dehalococcoidia bacterium]|nr:glycogen debranching N-terminal domain-containing protein [Dehalococcoidia bacterium]
MEEPEAVPDSEEASSLGFLPEAEPMAVQDIRDALVIRERDIFLLTDRAGEVPPGNINGYGLYYADTRYLSTYHLRLGEIRPVVLLSTAELGYSSEQVLTNPSMPSLEGRLIPRGTIEIRRLRVVEDVLEETLRITNYNPFPVSLDLALHFEADFADVFEVRGHRRESHGELRPPLRQDSALIMAYKGRDGHTRQTVIMFTPEPQAIDVNQQGAVVRFRVSLTHRESAAVRLVIAMDGRLDAPQGVERFGVVAQEYAAWLHEATRVYTDNDFFNAVLERSLADIRMLWNYEGAGGAYPAAGTPWFDTLFGRDSCVVGLQTLAFKPEIARDCLLTLSRWQGKKFDSWRDEEPGKLPHELRRGELTQTGELPFSPYYGSIDSTPLFMWLAAEYYQWTGDLELLQQLETNLRAALYWVERYGDADGDGYVEYEKRSDKGLVNQGWKDSGDSIIQADGRPVKPPIALVEVQGDLYAAWRKLAPLFAALGDEETAAQLLKKAAALKRRFNRDFWLAEGFFALALDGKRRPAASTTSNAGHALWTGVAFRPHANQVVERLMRNDMFSGWGIRTLSTTSVRFNPYGYHLGTVWPHDNSIVAMGFKRYGFEDELNEVATALFDAARAFPYYRLPELFGGAARSAHQAPVPYPVACRPQAWAAGAFPLITQAILGLCPDGHRNRLYVVKPLLPEWLDQIQVEGLKVGSGEADLYFERRGRRTRVHVLDLRGGLKVELVREWPG